MAAVRSKHKKVTRKYCETVTNFKLYDEYGDNDFKLSWRFIINVSPASVC